jgi:hypothetical protein
MLPPIEPFAATVEQQNGYAPKQANKPFGHTVNMLWYKV